MKIPNFFIVGAPKCGTSALSEYLRHHPNVFFSDPKELGYFLNEEIPVIVGGVHVLSELDDYLEYFREANVNHLAVGEGTPLYLYSESAIPNILNFNPEARLIVMVRNPVDLVYSFHGDRAAKGNENTLDFEEAWRKQDERRNGRSILEPRRHGNVLLYSDAGMLGRQLERLLCVAPAEQVKVIVFDDFIRAPHEAYEDVLAFLDLPSDHRTWFPQINPSKRVRSRVFGDMLRPIIRSTIRTKRALGIRSGMGVLKWLDQSNTEPHSRPSLSASFEAELRDFFREDIELLSQLIGRDLSPWLSGERLTEGAPKGRR